MLTQPSFFQLNTLLCVLTFWSFGETYSYCWLRGCTFERSLPQALKIVEQTLWVNLTIVGPCIANIFAGCNQQDVTFHNFFISVRRSTRFRRVFRPSSGAQNCTYSVRYLSDRYCYLLLARPG